MTDITLAPEEKARFKEIGTLIGPGLTESIAAGVYAAMEKVPSDAPAVAIDPSSEACCEAVGRAMWVQCYLDAANRGFDDGYCVQRANTAVNSFAARFSPPATPGGPGADTSTPTPAPLPAV